MQRRLAELERDFEAMGLTGFPRGLRRSKPGRMDYVLALQDANLERYRREGVLTPAMEWMSHIESPQLACSQSGVSDEDFHKIVDSSDSFVEEKFDGNRMLICYTPEIGWEFFSRNRSVTDYCAARYRDQILGFEGNSWVNFFKKSFIIDSELISLNPTINGRIQTETMLNAVTSLLALNQEDSHKAQIEAGYPLRFKCFDLLMFNGKNLFNVQEEKRKQLLGQLLDAIHSKKTATGEEIPQLGWLEFVKAVYGSYEVKEAYYKEVTGRGGEGLIIKNRFATYEPIEARSPNRWLKWKRTVSESIDPNGSDIDAYIVSGEKGSDGTANENLIGSVNLAVMLIPSGKEHVIARCSNIEKSLREKMTKINPDGSVELNPDYIKKVVSIDGQDISARAKRFMHARITAWRPDKNWFDCTFEQARLDDLIL